MRRSALLSNRLRLETAECGSSQTATDRPEDRDDCVHIEYVPTQVVTEFLRTTKLPEVVSATNAL